MSKQYGYKPARIVSGLTAQAVGEELERIEMAADGLTPPAVVEASRPEDALLHDHFTWHDPEAAHQWRLQEARQIINCVTVIPEGCSKPVQAWVSVREVTCEEQEADELPNRGYQYQPVELLMGDAGTRAALMAQLRAELKAMRRKHEAFAEFADVWAAVDRL